MKFTHQYEVRLRWWIPKTETFVVEAESAGEANDVAKTQLRERENSRKLIAVTDRADRLTSDAPGV